MSEAAQLPVVVYDGECAFCRRQIARIRRYDRHGRFECVPRQTPGLTDRFPALGQGGFDTGMRLIVPDGRIYVGADSVYQISRQLAVFRWFAWLYRVPGVHVLARAVYGWIAARRRSLGRRCDDGACSVPVRPNGAKHKE